MSKKPTYEELEQRVKELGAEATARQDLTPFKRKIPAGRIGKKIS
jgi:hypothetical protein